MTLTLALAQARLPRLERKGTLPSPSPSNPTKQPDQARTWQVCRAPSARAPQALEAAMQEDEVTREVWAAAKAVAQAAVETERTLHGWRVWYEDLL